jgi:N-formylmaleamate deformylase
MDDGRVRAWREGNVDTDDARLPFVRTGGAGPPVVLLHGLMGDGACWSPLARALEAEFDVVMPDARAHGRSSAPDVGYAYEDLASDVVGIVDHLHLVDPVLVGHSMGGMTAAVAAQRIGTGLRGLVLVDPTFLGPELQQQVRESEVAEQHRRALSESKNDLLAAALARSPHRSAETIELQVTARLNTRMNAFAVLRPPNPDHRTLSRDLEIPTLLVIGDAPVVSPELASELCDLNPLITVAQIPEAGHGLPFDQPEQLAAAVIAFLHQLPAVSERP